MSRIATPTDNPIIESINGCINSELHCDYTKEEKSDLPIFLNKYVEYFNNETPAYALGYLSPIQHKVENGFL